MRSMGLFLGTVWACSHGLGCKGESPLEYCREQGKATKRNLHAAGGFSRIMYVPRKTQQQYPEGREDPSPEAEQACWSYGSVGALLIPPTPISIVPLYNGDNNNPGAGINYWGILSNPLCGGCWATERSGSRSSDGSIWADVGRPVQQQQAGWTGDVGARNWSSQDKVIGAILFLTITMSISSFSTMAVQESGWGLG